MNMPGFTAEASLRQTSNRYILAECAHDVRSSERIIPQARVLEGFCFRDGSYCCFKNPDGTWTCARTIST